MQVKYARQFSHENIACVHPLYIQMSSLKIYLINYRQMFVSNNKCGKNIYT